MYDYNDRRPSLPFHFAKNVDTNEWVSVYNVPRGKNTNCYCPVCGEPVGAKNKDKSLALQLQKHQKTAHFYHISKSNCDPSGETIYHLVAKEILEKSKRLFVYSPYEGYSDLVGKTSLVVFDEVIIEKRVSDQITSIQPDAIGIKGKSELYIEFKVTSGINNQKREYLERNKIDCIEIDINEARKGCDPNDIEKIRTNITQLLENGRKNSFRWVRNKKLVKHLKFIRKTEEEKRKSAIEKIKELYSEIEALKEKFWLSDDDLK
ncbi:hypothetical protein [Sediminicola sp. 1XM1-17]|uniref:hypothetical protein n=1 Tax=Sediminicola sp. 1XM1-17 TaxID=3127702 RepID=UPI00307753AD